MMNSKLKQYLAERRVTKPAGLTCVSIGPQASGVIVELWERESWVLPWSCLLSARLGGTREKAELTLSFSTQVVSAYGQNLQAALDAVAGFRLGLLRELPPLYQTQLPEMAPFIARLEVVVSEQTQRDKSRQV